MVKTSRGFTLIELIIVIVIIGILSAVGAPIFRKHVRKSLGAEAYALAAAVSNAERVYYSEYGAYVVVNDANPQQGNASIPVDARPNSHFRRYQVAVSGAQYTITVTGTSPDASGMVLTGVGTPSDYTPSDPNW